MIYVKLITIGELPSGPLKELEKDYLKRLGPYVKFDFQGVADETKIENQLDDKSLVIVLDELGKSFTSKQLADKIKGFEDDGQHLTVIIGGPFGLSDKTKKRAGLLLALSPMTLTHDFAHLLFLEQLYRAFTIIRDKKYHY